MSNKARLMGPLFYIIEGLQIRNTLFIKTVTLANEILSVPLNGITRSVERQSRWRSVK